MFFNYATRLNAAIRAKQTPALVGLDPRFEWLPDDVIKSARSRCATEREVVATAYEEFCCRVIDVVAPLVPAVKPQSAFFEELGPSGGAALATILSKARKAGLITICDAKRGDIGSTAEAYARAYLAGADPQSAPWSADALTVNPYLGRDTLDPFVHRAKECGGGIYVLVRTSNPGAGSFQDPRSEGIRLYERVAAVVEELATAGPQDEGFGIVGAVVGATYPGELSELRAAMPHVPLLVPGYGSQGGTSADVAGAFRADGLGGLVNSSRGINFAFRKAPYAGQFAPDEWEAAIALATKEMIADLAEHTFAGQLRADTTSSIV